MTLSPRTRTIVWVKAGGRCSFPDCRTNLVREGEETQLIGELAHNVAQKRDGPRGQCSPPGGDLDGPGNLLLLCPTHHTEIDKDESLYTVQRLTQIKQEHERWVESLKDTQFRSGDEGEHTAQLETETVHSTLLPVIAYPRHVYSAATSCSEADVRPLLDFAQASRIEMLPFIVRSGRLFTFYNLNASPGPFWRAVRGDTVNHDESEAWWRDGDRRRWYVSLLNRSLNKLTGRLGLMFDREHQRFYFEPVDGGARTEEYKTLTGRSQTRLVAWQPTFRHSGELKNYWEHLAVGLRFHLVGDTSWVLSVRPERRFTRDGKMPLRPKATGRRSTSKKSRMYNSEVLEEVVFWRHFLSQGRPRIHFNFGDQSLMVSSELLRSIIEWPGVKDDARPFTNLAYQENLFTYQELLEVEEAESTNSGESEDSE